jgi:hypothetical protein
LSSSFLLQSRGLAGTALLDTALETIETGLTITIALPGSKYQYYEDIIKQQQRVLEDLSDEIKHQALNRLDDYFPQAPPGSPPQSPSSPEYCPVYYSSIMEYPDYASDSTDGTERNIFDDGNNEPITE